VQVTIVTMQQDLARRFLIADFDARREDPEHRYLKPGFIREVEVGRLQIPGYLPDRFALDEMLPPNPVDRLHCHHSPTARLKSKQMQYLGECLTPWWINSDVGSLADEKPVDGKKFRFMRYDLRLEWQWIELLRERVGAEEFDEKFGRKLTETEVIRMRSIDDPTIIEDIYNLARIAAKDQVKPEHWIGEMATWCNSQGPSAEPRRMVPRESDPSLGSFWIACFPKVGVALSYLRSALVRLLYSRSI
jgi:hypothetical protein